IGQARSRIAAPGAEARPARYECAPNYRSTSGFVQKPGIAKTPARDHDHPLREYAQRLERWGRKANGRRSGNFRLPPGPSTRNPPTRRPPATMPVFENAWLSNSIAGRGPRFACNLKSGVLRDGLRITFRVFQITRAGNRRNSDTLHRWTDSNLPDPVRSVCRWLRAMRCAVVAARRVVCRLFAPHSNVRSRGCDFGRRRSDMGSP